MNYKKFLSTFFLLIFFYLIIIVLFNYFADPFSIFCEPKYEKIKNKVLYCNERYLKMKYLLLNKDKFDSFLFGSCSCRYMNLQSPPLKEGSWYNFNSGDTMMWDIKRTLTFMLSQGIKPKRIIVQTSDQNLKDPEGTERRCKKYLNYCPYPITFPEKIRFYGFYLISLPVDTVNESWPERYKKNIFESGSYISKQVSFPSQSSSTKLNTFMDINDYYDAPCKKFPFLDIHLLYLSDIINICKENNIEFTLFFVPEYYEMHQLMNIDEFNEIKRKIVKMTPFYDFTGFNEITLNKFNFIDPGHVNEWTSKLIIDRIFHSDKNTPPAIKGFGVYVTQDNIEEHIKNLKKEELDFKKKHQ